MTQIFNITDDTVFINTLSLNHMEGPVIHTGSFDIIGRASVQSDLMVAGSITVDTINVRNLVSPTIPSGNFGNWAGESDADLNGKGFSWSYGESSTQLIYRTGNRIWCNGSIDLDIAASYKIDNIPVISINTLGSSIIKSNLRSVGSLNSLNVMGDTNLGEFAFFKTTTNRLGLGTDEPNASISIIDNNVEIAIGSPRSGMANIGTYSNHDLSIITDDIARIVVKNNGEVQIGDPANKNSILTVYGSIFAQSIISDTRLARSTSLEFTSVSDDSMYGKGLLWTGTGIARQLVMMSNPDRLWTSESVDIGTDQTYSVNGEMVLSSNTLGSPIVNSSLTTVGTLSTLTVSGITYLSTAHIDTLQIAKISSDSAFSVSVQHNSAFYADNTHISIGDKQNSLKPVKVFGQLSIGINNPDPTVSLSVNGSISFSNKKFLTGNDIPSIGAFFVGDICWNQTPKEHSYIGWVCIVAGEPGIWAPFGMVV